MLGNGGASEDMRVIMEDTQKKYKDLKKMALGKHAFNDFVFGSEPKHPVHNYDFLIKKTEDEQVGALLKSSWPSAPEANSAH